MVWATSIEQIATAYNSTNQVTRSSDMLCWISVQESVVLVLWRRQLKENSRRQGVVCADVMCHEGKNK